MKCTKALLTSHTTLFGDFCHEIPFFAFEAMMRIPIGYTPSLTTKTTCLAKQKPGDEDDYGDDNGDDDGYDMVSIECSGCGIEIGRCCETYRLNDLWPKFPPPNFVQPRLYLT